jgi:PKD repeat protein
VDTPMSAVLAVALLAYVAMRNRSRGTRGPSRVVSGSWPSARGLAVAVSLIGGAFLALLATEPAHAEPADTAPVVSWGVSPRYFSPNGDGQEDEIGLAFCLSQSANVDLWVTGPDGTRVRTLESAVSHGGGSCPFGANNYITWDGHTDTGTTVPDGTYTVHLSATNTGGHSGEATLQIGTDNRTPGTLTTPTPGQTLAGLARFVVTPTPGFPIEGVDLCFTGSGCTPIFNASPDGTWRTSIYTSQLPDGPTSITPYLKWTDPFGAQHYWTAPVVPVVVDRTSLPLSIVADPTSGQAPLDTTVRIDTSDPLGRTVHYSVNFGDGSSPSFGDVDTPYPTIDVPHTYANPGAFRAVVTVTNSAGEASVRAVDISVAGRPNTAPVATLTVDATSGVVPLPVSVAVGGADADGDALTYTLDFGDGTAVVTGTLPHGPVSHTYTSAGTRVVRLAVSDGRLATVRTTTVTVGLAEPLAAHAGDDQVVVAGNAVQFDASASRPLLGIEQYRWTFGDGGSATGPVVEHTYGSVGTYTATLTVTAGGVTRTDTAVVRVILPPVEHGLTVKVTDGAAAIDAAALVIVDSNGQRFSATTNSAGTGVLKGLPDGQYAIYGWKVGYLPATVTATVQDGVGTATLTMPPGRAATASLTAAPLTLDEIVDAGIDPADPDNQHVYRFEVHLAFQPLADPVVVTGYVSGDGDGNGFFPKGIDVPHIPQLPCLTVCGFDLGPGYSAKLSVQWVDNQPQLLWLIIPGKGSWLKEFFSVQMMVTNLAPAGFTLTSGTASLQLPDGLTLAPTAQPQSQTVAVDGIAGGSSRSATWVIRGDREGLYDLSASYAGVLDPVGQTVTLSAATDRQLRVWGGSSVQLVVDTDDAAYAGAPYRIRVGLRNVADVPVYNPAMELLKEGKLNYIYQPRERFLQSVAVLQPGETFWADYILVPTITGTLDLSHSFVKKTGGDVHPADVITSHRLTPSLLIQAAPDSGGVKVKWTAVPGATEYAIYATPSRDQDFPDTALAVVPAGTTEAVVPGGPTTYFAVSPLIDGRPVMRHPLIRAGQIDAGRGLAGDVNGDGVVRWAILGDSYISGEGFTAPGSDVDGDPVTGYEPGTDDDEGRNTCHRARTSWAYRVATIYGARGANLLFAACSGATTADILTNGQQRESPDDIIGKHPQIDELRRFSEGGLPDVILLGIGGNDAGFEGVVVRCAMPNMVLALPAAGTTVSTECRPTMSATQQADLQKSIQNTILRLNLEAPGARVLISNYVNPITPAQSFCPSLITLSEAEQTALAGYLGQLNGAVDRAARLAGAKVLDVAAAFDGNGMCTGSGYMNGIRMSNDWSGLTDASGALETLRPDSESVHPTDEGHTVLATDAAPGVATALSEPAPAPQISGPVTVEPHSYVAERYFVGADGRPGTIIQYYPAHNEVIQVATYSLPTIVGRFTATAGVPVNITGLLPSSLAPGWHIVELRNVATGELVGTVPYFVPTPAGCTADPATGDIDGDSYPDGCDADPTDGPLADVDGDTIVNGLDNCAVVSNTNQADTDADGTGDACDPDQGSPLFAGYRTMIDDSTPPTVTADLPPPNDNGWHRGPVTITWRATDPAPTSGPATTLPPTTADTEGLLVPYTSTASCDPAGNCGTGTTKVSIDRTAPTITATLTPPATGGVFAGPVTVHFTCADALSGIATCPADVVLDRAGSGQAVTGTVADYAGNTTSITIDDIDIQLPPTVTTQPGDATAATGESVTFTAAATGDPIPTVRWQRSIDGGSTWADIEGATAAAYVRTVTAQDNGSAYRAVFTNPVGTATSRTAVLSVPGAATSPAQPAAISATRGDTTATVTWTPGADGGSPVTSYTVTAAPGGSTATVPAPATTATLTGLTNGTAYTFTVTATNAIGVSAPSEPSAPIVPAGVPGVPGAVSAARGDGEVLVSWTPAADNGAPIGLYRVVVAPGGASVTATGDATTAVVAGLTNGTAYTVTVTAVNDVGDGPTSPPSAPVSPSGRPGTPTAVTAVAGDASATVSWSPPATNGAPITSYTLTLAPGGQAVTVPGSVTSATVVNLTNGTSYTFTVTATNEGGTGPASAPSNAVVPRAAPLPVPTVTLVSGPPAVTSARDARFVFTLSDPNYPTNMLVATCRVDGGPNRTCTQGLTLTKLADGQHTLTVRATNPAGRVSAPLIVTWRVDTKAPRVDLVNASRVVLGPEVTVRWTGNDGNGTGIASYDVRYRTATHATGFGGYVQPAEWNRTTATSATRPAVPGTEYCFQVRARDFANNLTAWSTEQCRTVPLDDPMLHASRPPWYHLTTPATFGGTLTATTTQGAALQKSLQYRRLWLVATTCPSCGTVAIYHNGKLLKSVNLASATTRNQVVIPIADESRVRSGSITIVVTSRSRPVLIDGLVCSQAP